MCSPSKSSRPATNIGTIDESDSLGFFPSSSSSSTTSGYHREKPSISINLDTPPLINSHPGNNSRHRDRDHREVVETSSSESVAITITDLSGGFSPSEVWRRSATKDKDKDKDKYGFENHAFSPPTSSQQTGVRQSGR